jgi:D-tyrosyl-tRNA(Tyr) deacylase
LVFLGFEKNDQKPQVDKMINKLLAYRIFADEQGKMNLSVADINGGVTCHYQYIFVFSNKFVNKI